VRSFVSRLNEEADRFVGEDSLSSRRAHAESLRVGWIATVDHWIGFEACYNGDKNDWSAHLVSLVD
jgi:hypothetical protein